MFVQIIACSVKFNLLSCSHVLIFVLCVADLKSYFQECVTNFKSTPTLAHLRTLEKRIAEKFKFKDFSQLQQGTFLDFIFNNKKVCVSTCVMLLMASLS